MIECGEEKPYEPPPFDSCYPLAQACLPAGRCGCLFLCPLLQEILQSSNPLQHGFYDPIARFPSTANPAHWAYPEMRSMMHNHLDLTTQEVVARLKKDWQADIAAYDRVHEQILGMADMLSAGIEEQFAARSR